MVPATGRALMQVEAAVSERFQSNASFHKLKYVMASEIVPLNLFIDIDSLRKSFHIAVFNQPIAENLQLKSLTTNISTNGENKTFASSLCPEIVAQSYHVLEYQNEIDVVSLAFGNEPYKNVKIESVGGGDPIVNTGSNNGKPTIDTMPESKATDTSHEVPEATTSNATTSGTKKNSLKRKQPMPEDNDSNQPKKQMNEAESTPHVTFTITSHFAPISEPDTAPAVPVNPDIDETTSDSSSDDNSTLDGDVRSPIGPDVDDFALNFDNSSNYSSALTDEDKYDTFIQSLE